MISKQMSNIIEVAEKEIGYKEKDNANLTKYGEWFGMDGFAWCGIFVSWVYAQAGKQLPKIGFTKGFAGCQTFFAYAVKNNWIIKKEDAQEGDIVLFDWNFDGRYDHVGLFVKKIDSRYFESIEGNTSNVNDSNGGEVMRRKRSYPSAIFIRPVL